MFMVCWSFLKASYCLAPHVNSAHYFNSLDNSLVIEARPGINHLTLETLPKKLLSSLAVASLLMVAMIVTLAGSTLMPF